MIKMFSGPRRLCAATAFGLVAMLPGSALAGCSDAAEPCQVTSGSYHIALPDNPATSEGLSAMVFLHGAGSNGGNTMRNKAMTGPMLERGYAVIAPNGLKRSRHGAGWSFHPDWPENRDELAFVNQVLDDTVTRFGIDRSRVILAGFSISGSMASYIACKAPDDFAAFAPVAGSFWDPLPFDCEGPVRLLHTHGWRDRTVPLEGRPLGGGTVRQGDVFAALGIWRETNGCGGQRADSFQTNGVFWRREWERCAPGTALEFALHTGGHTVPAGWSDMVLDWFENLPQYASPEG
jgi:polyhydroxybutyrate depolymerase